MSVAMQEQGGFDAPLVIVFAGPNGSGKSTINERILKDPEFNFQGEYINADDITKSLIQHISNALERNIKAAQIAEQRRLKAMEEGRSFAFETVMSTPEKVAIMTQAKAKGYSVSLIFITTDNPEKNVHRVADRVSKGGHPVAPDAIRSRYHKTMALLPCAVDHADVALIVDNSQLHAIDVAFKQDGQLIEVATNPPQWVADKLINPYKNRTVSLEKINQAFSACCTRGNISLPAIINHADAGHGNIYQGEIIEVTTHHALQQTGVNQFLIHDRSLSAPQKLHKGKQATIGYAYDKGKMMVPTLQR